jgi:cysteinyl-tRNA synthetase
MTAGESKMPDLNSHTLLARLQSADTALRACLNQARVESLIRVHIERALAHIREAETALHNLARARTVERLAEQLARIDEMREELRSQDIAIVNTTLFIRN